MIYLDNNATTPLDPAVAASISLELEKQHANAGSQHQAGRMARRTLESAREAIAKLFGLNCSDIHADHVVVTSGATEANNLALRGLLANRIGSGARVVISSQEHPSVDQCVEFLAAAGHSVVRVNSLSNGTIDLDHLESVVDGDTAAVSVIHANNETGIIQPLTQISEICRQAGAPLHTDAVQAVGKTEWDFGTTPVTSATISAHKLHGPVGVGALLLRHGAHLYPQITGGFQQQGFRAGTESVFMAVALAKTLELCCGKDAQGYRQELCALRDRFEAQIISDIPDVQVIGADVPRVPHTSCLSFQGLDRQAIQMALDAADICCSTGSACASGSSEPSPTLISMGLSSEVIEGAVRFSFGRFNTADEIDSACERISSVIKHLRR